MPQAPHSRSAVSSPRRYLLVALLGAVAVLPVWIPAFPAMCDAPQIASQVAAYSQLGNASFLFADLYVAHTQMPNLAGYGALLLLKPLIGVVAACKLVVSAALLFFLLSSAWLIAEFEGDPRWAAIAIPGLFGFTFQWGLIGFLCTAPLGIAFVVVALRYFRQPSRLAALRLVLLCVLLFFCHAMIAAYAVAAASLCALLELRSARQLFARWLPMLLPIAIGGAWWLHSIAGNPQTHRPPQWQLGWERVPALFVGLAGWPDDAISAAIIVLLTAPPIALLGLRRGVRFYLLPALALAIAFFAPHSIFGVDAVYQRFAIFVLPSLAIALRPREGRRARLATAWLVAFSLLWSVGLAWRMTVFEREARGFASLLNRMRPGKRLLSFSFNRHSRVFAGAVFLHHSAWYAALEHGVTDPSFACGNVDLVLYRELPPVRFADFEFHPDQFNWLEHRGAGYQYFVVRSPREQGGALFAAAPHPITLLAHEGEWWLYENPRVEE